MAFHRKRGTRSSGILITFWISLVIYGSIKLRTLILISEDQVSCNSSCDIILYTDSEWSL